MLNHCKPICDALANLLYLDRFWCSSVLSLLSSSGKCAIHQISINLSEVISLHCVRGVACARIKSFVVYKNFMLVVLMVVAIAHQFNKNTSEMESFFVQLRSVTILSLAMDISPKREEREWERENDRKSLNSPPMREREPERVQRLRWIRSRWEVPIEYEIRTRVYRMICVWDWAVSALAQPHHQPWTLFVFISYSFSLSRLFSTSLVQWCCLSIGHCVLGKKQKLLSSQKIQLSWILEIKHVPWKLIQLINGIHSWHK